MPLYTGPVSAISFARGAPAPECIPVEELADCARAAISGGGSAVLGYGAAGGYEPLREWIAARHGVEPRRILITNGSLQGFVFLAQHLLRERGGRVLVEAPTYDRPLKILSGLGAHVVTVAMDEEGLDVDALERELAAGGAAFVYTIPTFQNPSGRTLAAARRHRIVELARAHDVPVLEDDPYGLVRFEGAAPPTLHELDGGAHVVYSSSFSKTIAPGLRVGYYVLTNGIVEALEAAALSTYISPVTPAQATVWEFIRRGSFDPNLERVRALLRSRRDAMLAALADELPDGARWSRPEGGYFVWLDLPGGVDAAELLERATAAGVTFVRGRDFFPDGAGGSGSARLAFSFAAPDEIREGIARLSSLLPSPAPV